MRDGEASGGTERRAGVHDGELPGRAECAAADYDLGEAERAFYKAYEVMNSGGVNNASRSAAAVMLAEKVKVWKGEPFERAMANFYLGLVYYMRQDYANARAAFENALFKLRDYGESGKTDQYQEQESNFTIAYIMLAKCWQKLGNPEKATDLFTRASKLRPDLAYLVEEAKQDSNVLIVADAGIGPRKVTQYDNSVVAFVPKPQEVGPLPRLQVRLNGQAISLGGAEVASIDLLELAQERQWQSMDTIRLAKSAVGTGLMGVGAYQGMKHHPDYGSAAAFTLGGLALKATATADVRHWETLPRTVYIVPLSLKPGQYDITVGVGDRLAVAQTWRNIVAPQQGEATYYMRISRFNTGPFDWPPPNLAAEQGGAAPAAAGAAK